MLGDLRVILVADLAGERPRAWWQVMLLIVAVEYIFDKIDRSPPAGNRSCAIDIYARRSFQEFRGTSH